MLVLMHTPSGDKELIQIVDAALADAASRAGNWLVCRPGCTQCCHGAFAIGPLDAARLRSGMDALLSSAPALAAELERRATDWIAAHAPDFPGNVQTGILGDSDADQARFDDFANDAPCPALNPATGLCDIYAWRPMTCRVFGPPIRMDAGLDVRIDAGETEALCHCELCFQGATTAQIAACEMPLPHALEASLLDQFPDPGETVVAFALLRQ